ncbi:hypothetical protein MJO29_001180 [Puccinia striiformis f. sp. tritici]|nr:hypothetical protein MJO29_001180 [Puccinia striiformis f. sp. tritici]
MKEASSAKLVIGTNDSSILSKRSAERIGYFTQNQYLKEFVSKPQRRTSLINIGYTIRTLLVDLLIKRFLDSSTENRVTIINLGCGYDPTFFKLVASTTNQYQDFRYVDVDYPELIAKKYQLISQSEELNQILPGFKQTKIGDWIQLPKCSYALLGCDLNDSQDFIHKLTHSLGIQENDHILFVSEVSTVYMPAERSDLLIQDLCLRFPNMIWSCLEQVLSTNRSGFSITMLNHFNKLKTPIRGTLGYPTLSHQVNRLNKHWNIVEMSTMLDLWKAFDDHPATRIEKERIIQLEEFDEWEELDLFLSHYILGIAYSNPNLMIQRVQKEGISLPALRRRICETPSKTENLLPWKNYTSIETSIQRRGHTSTSLPDGRILIFGGFGLPPSNTKRSTHSRLSNPIILKLSSQGSIHTVQLPMDSSTPSSRLYHTASLISVGESSYVFLFGGRTSPQTPLFDVHLFNCATNQWSPITPSGSDPWPAPRFRHVALSIQIGNSSCVLVHGGIGLDREILQDSWLFDPSSNSWTHLVDLDQLIGPRHSHQVYYDSVEQHFYVFGGVSAICDGFGTNRIGRNIRFTYSFKNHSIALDSSELLTFNSLTHEPLLHRYAHRIIEWDQPNKTLIMSGGISENGVIDAENQYIYLNLKFNTYQILDLPRLISAPIMIGHSFSILDLTDTVKVALVIGGGATCFSFGSNFDTHIEIISDSDLLISNLMVSKEKPTQKSMVDGSTFDHSSEDTWDKPTELSRLDLAKQGWLDVIAEAVPVIFNTQLQIGNCLDLWSNDYLKLKCGHKKCSVHVSNPTKSPPSTENNNNNNTLKWHDKNFKYQTMNFKELIDRTLEIPIPDQTDKTVLYLRSLSNSPKLPSNFDLDFKEISHGFQIPQVIKDYIQDQNRFFSSVLRVSGADMGLWAHYDTYDNVLVQIKGIKIVRLWHPKEIVNLYIDGSSSHIPSFDPPDLDKFPLYRKSYPMICTLKPGDTLFIPANWIHAVQTIEPSISINTFFKTDQLSKFYVDPNKKKDIWGNLDLSPYHDLHDRIFKDFLDLPKSDQHNFMTLPLNQRQFYLKKIGMDLIRYADQLSESSP